MRHGRNCRAAAFCGLNPCLQHDPLAAAATVIVVVRVASAAAVVVTTAATAVETAGEQNQNNDPPPVIAAAAVIIAAAAATTAGKQDQNNDPPTVITATGTPITHFVSPPSFCCRPLGPCYDIVRISAKMCASSKCLCLASYVAFLLTKRFSML